MHQTTQTDDKYIRKGEEGVECCSCLPIRTGMKLLFGVWVLKLGLGLFFIGCGYVLASLDGGWMAGSMFAAFGMLWVFGFCLQLAWIRNQDSLSTRRGLRTAWILDIVGSCVVLAVYVFNGNIPVILALVTSIACSFFCIKESNRFANLL